MSLSIGSGISCGSGVVGSSFISVGFRVISSLILAGSGFGSGCFGCGLGLGSGLLGSILSFLGRLRIGLRGRLRLSIVLLNLVHLLCDDVLGCRGGGLSGVLGRLSGDFGGIFLLSFVLLGLFSSFLLELLEFVDLLFDLCRLLVGLMLGMGGSLSSLLLDLGSLSFAGLALFIVVMAVFLVGKLFLDLLLGLMLCLLDGVNLRVFSMDKLIMLGLSRLFSLCLGRLGGLLLSLKLLNASIHFFIMLLLFLLIMSLVFLASGLRIICGFLDIPSVLTIVLLGNSLGSLLVGTAAATELLTDMLDDGVVVASQSLGIDTVKVLVSDLILELGLDLGTDTLDDLACGDLLAAGAAV